MDLAAEITAHDLKVLSIGYYIQAGLLALYTLLVVGYLAFIGALITAASATGGQSGREGFPPGLVPFW